MRSNPVADAPEGANRAAVHGLVLLAIAFVSVSYPVGKAITGALDPAALNLVRFVIATAILGPIVALQYGLSWPSFASLLRYGALSGVYVAFFWSMFEGLRYTSALNQGALYTLVPGLTAVWGAILVGERLGGRRLVALAIGLVGALWVVFRGDIDRLVALDLNAGDLIFLAGCGGYAVYTPLVRRFYRGEPMAVMTFWTLATGVAWLLAIANRQVWTTDWAAVGVDVWLGIVYLAIFSTIGSFYLFQYTSLRIGPTRVVSYNYLTPALVLLVDWGFGKGWPPAMTFPGIAIVVAAMLVLQRGEVPTR